MTSGLWYRADLRDDPLVAGQVPTIREQFADALAAAGWPEGACLFAVSRHGPDRTAREDDSAADADALFFSPAAVSAVPHLIAVCGAAPSPPPDRSRATLLVGKPSDWDLLPYSSH